jgi:hypothetical protein
VKRGSKRHDARDAQRDLFCARHIVDSSLQIGLPQKQALLATIKAD